MERTKLETLEAIKDAMRVELGKMAGEDGYYYEGSFASSAMFNAEYGTFFKQGEFLREQFVDGLEFLLLLAMDEEDNHLYEVTNSELLKQAAAEIADEYKSREIEDNVICKVR